MLSLNAEGGRLIGGVKGGDGSWESSRHEMLAVWTTWNS